MRQNLQYRILFSAMVEHDFYLSEDKELYRGDSELRKQVLDSQKKDYTISQFLSVVPTKDCANYIRNSNLIFKTNNNGFIVGARVLPVNGDRNFTTALPLGNAVNLRFTLTSRSPFFFNFTNLRIEKGNKPKETYIYYFTNRNSNVVNHPGLDARLYLSKPLGGYQRDRDYEAGELILQDGKLFEALEDIPGDTVFNSESWREIYRDQDPHFQFVSVADRLLLRPAIFRHIVHNDLENHKILNIILYSRDDVVVAKLQFKTSDSTLKDCLIDLSNYDPGTYRLEVRRVDNTTISEFGIIFYLDDLLFRQKPLALIECFYTPNTDLGEYRWLDENNNHRLRSPVYRLRWKSRPTYWRYYFNAPVNILSESNQVIQLPAPHDRILQTREPFALSQIMRKVEISLNGENVPKPLPNPNITKISPENGQVFSEIDMGGGLG